VAADRPTHPETVDRAGLDEQRRLHDAAVDQRAQQAALRRQAAVGDRRRQQDDDDRRRHLAEQQRAAERRVSDEQVRLRHLAEDEERRRRQAYDAALRRERVVTHLARTDPARSGELLRAQQDVTRTEAQWREADEVRRRWPSRWPW